MGLKREEEGVSVSFKRAAEREIWDSIIESVRSKEGEKMKTAVCKGACVPCVSRLHSSPQHDAHSPAKRNEK